MSACVYCWHRPGMLRYFKHVVLRMCRNCGVPIEECPCVSWGRTPNASCPACEGSGWCATVRSRQQTIRDSVEL
jgi:hypothetical protein